MKTLIATLALTIAVIVPAMAQVKAGLPECDVPIVAKENVALCNSMLKFREDLKKVAPQRTPPLMLKCSGQSKASGGNVEPVSMGMLLNFDNRIAFAGGWLTMDMVQVTDNQILMRHRSNDETSRTTGFVDRVTGYVSIVTEDKTIGRLDMDLHCVPAKALF